MMSATTNLELETGDELIDTNEDTRVRIEDVNDDADEVTFVALNDEGKPLADTRETVTGEEMQTALVDGIFAADDAEGHELVKHF